MLPRNSKNRPIWSHRPTMPMMLRLNVISVALQCYVMKLNALLLFSNGPIPAPFCLFLSFSCYNFNNTNWIKQRWCAWDLNPGLQDGRRRRNHQAMAAACDAMLCNEIKCNAIKVMFDKETKFHREREISFV